MLTKFRQLIESVIELPNAAMACVEMSREAEANRESIRASEAFEAVCPGGPALYHANSRIEKLTNDSWSLGAQIEERDHEIADLTDKLDESERKLAREVEARRIRQFRMSDNDEEPNFGELPPEFRKVMYRLCDASFTSKAAWGIGTVGSLSCFEWRYLSPEDMP